MNEKLANALGYVDETYVAHAAKNHRKKKLFLTAVAALLALVFFWQSPTIPLVISARAVSLAPDSRLGDRPRHSSDQWDAWVDRHTMQLDGVREILPAVSDFSRECARGVFHGTQNQLWSPINAYIGLAMTAELAEGHTRQQVLNALNAPDLDTLRRGISAVWETGYENNNLEICSLANSIWMDEALTYDQEAMDRIAYYYYADIYQGSLGSSRTNRDMSHWMRNQTGGFLKDRAGSMDLSPDSVLVLASTIYFQSRWNEEFSSGQNTEDVFHSPDGDRTVTYMNARELEQTYYWGEDYGAVSLLMENGSQMWLILPDEDRSIDDVVRSGAYLDLITQQSGTWQGNSKRMKVNLSLPKFDIHEDTNLEEALTAMGMGDLFDPFAGNEFTITPAASEFLYLSQVNQDSRVAIDEKGVTAASYIELNFGAGAAEPPTEIIDFVLNRPFLFAITNRCDVPLFLGSVQNP